MGLYDVEDTTAIEDDISDSEPTTLRDYRLHSFSYHRAPVH